jgi:gamma-glutamyltranspeptidase/glutathione hydrolase
MTPTYDFPYPTPRLPVFGRNVVATSHAMAAQAGLLMLQRGGSAVDAAIAGAAMMTLVEPVSNGLGSDLFAMVWDGQQLQGLNASGQAPRAWTPEYFIHRHGADCTTPPMRGVDAVTVPGMVGGWVALHQRHGRLPLAEVLEPAAELAEKGYAVPVVVQQKWAAAVPLLQSQPGFAQVFMPHGRALEVGEHFALTAAARTIRAIGQTQGQAFYQGELARALTRFVQQHGGALDMADMQAYQPEWVTPIQANYRGYTVHEMPPNGQGIAALMALGMVQHFDLADMGPDDVLAQHIQIEAMKLAFADVYRHVADPRAMALSTQELLDPAYLAQRARLINPKQAQVMGAGDLGRGGTIYLNAADANGMMVSLIQSNYMGFGSGVVEPSTGISLHNRGHAFQIGADAPNPGNQVAPGKRPFHTIIPGFLSHQGQPVMAFGVMGANMQPQGHLQTLVRILDHQQNVQTACDAPRWRFFHGKVLNLEGTMAPALASGLMALGHEVSVIQDSYQDFGAGQFIWRQPDFAQRGYVAASDPRRDGAAAAWM